MSVPDAILLGTVIAAAIAALFGHRIRTPSAKQPLDPQIAIMGGALADTTALTQHTAAVLKLAEAHHARVDVEREALDVARKQNNLFDSAIDELKLLRRAAEEIVTLQRR